MNEDQSIQIGAVLLAKVLVSIVGIGAMTPWIVHVKVFIHQRSALGMAGSAMLMSKVHFHKS